MNLSSEQILKRWNILIEFIEQHFEGNQKENILKLYKHFEERMIDAPASSRPHHHNCFVGGYLDHVVRVTTASLDIKKQFEKLDVEVITTDSDIVLAAMFHDLGKLGFPGDGNEIYIPNESEWHRKNLGKIYTPNPKNPFSMVPDLTIWLLQHYGIKMTWNEMLGLKLTDGLYDESTKPYFISRTADSKLKTNLGYIMHQADCMAARIEYEKWNKQNVDFKPTTTVNLSYGKKARTQKIGNIAKNSNDKVNASKLFEDLFGDK